MLVTRILALRNIARKIGAKELRSSFKLCEQCRLLFGGDRGGNSMVEVLGCKLQLQDVVP